MLIINNISIFELSKKCKVGYMVFSELNKLLIQSLFHIISENMRETRFYGCKILGIQAE